MFCDQNTRGQAALVLVLLRRPDPLQQRVVHLVHVLCDEQEQIATAFYLVGKHTEGCRVE